MQDFPLVAMFNFAASAVCLVAAVKMYLVSRKNMDNIKILYFFYSFVFIAIYLSSGGIPLLFAENSFSVAVLGSLSRPFLLIGGMFLCLIPLNLMKAKLIEKIYILATLAVVLASSVLSFLGLGQVRRFFSLYDIEYWIHPDNPLLSLGVFLTGGFFIASLLFASVFFFRFALEKKGEEVAFGKALMIGTGCLLLILAVVSSHIIGIMIGDFIVTGTVASLLFIMGVVALIASVNYKGEGKKPYKT